MRIGISMPEDMVEYIDEISDLSGVSRSEVIQWVFTGIMDDSELASLFFVIHPDEEEEEEEPDEKVDEDVDEEVDEEEDD